MARRSVPAQALVEAALVLPILMLVAFGGIGMGRLIQARVGLSAAVREAARTTALAEMPSVRDPNDASARRTAVADGEQHGRDVAGDYGLPGADISVSVDRFEPGGWVTAEGSYEVRMWDVPFLRQVLNGRMSGGAIELRTQHLERIDRWRSLSP